MTALRTISLAGICAFALMLVACTKESAREHSATAFDSLPTLRTVPSFVGVDQTGVTFNSSSLRGTVWIGSFFFTSCQTICPALNRVVQGLQADFGSRVKFLSISSDPETDTPDVLAKYAMEYGAKQGTWTLMNMPYERMLDAASGGLGLIAPTEPAVHSTRMVLVDSAMRVRGYFDSDDTAAVRTLRAILQELH